MISNRFQSVYYLVNTHELFCLKEKKTLPLFIRFKNVPDKSVKIKYFISSGEKFREIGMYIIGVLRAAVKLDLNIRMKGTCQKSKGNR